MRPRLSLLALTLLSLTACDGASPGANDGPLALGIVSGNHQVATAGDDRLSDPVVGKLVRTPGGGIAFRFVTPAYAQDGTVVTGSPVPGAVVCAVSVTDSGLTPFTPCTNTASDGTATFFFSPGTRAGEATSEIRGTVDNQPAVFDTVVAKVDPGPAATGALYAECSGFGVASADTLGAAALGAGANPLQDAYQNSIPWRFNPFASSTLYTVTPDSQAIVAAPGASGIDSVRIMGSGVQVRVSYVYVRHPQLPGTRLMIYNWPPDRQCGDVSIPTP